MLRALLELSRVSNLPTVWTNVIAAWVLANGQWQWQPQLAWLLVGASLVYSAGMILNDVFDVAWDREHRPERPIPSGRMSFSTALGIGAAWLIGGALLMVMLGGAKWSYTLALVIAILAYDLYHKPWTGSVIVMGACRTLLYCVAASAQSSGSCKLSPIELALFPGIELGLYVVALTLSARMEGKKTASLWKRWILGCLLILPATFALLDLHAGNRALLELLLVIAPFLLVVGVALRKLRQGGPAIGQAVGWMLAAIPAVDALAIVHVSLPLALSFVAMVPFLRLWQRWIAAT